MKAEQSITALMTENKIINLSVDFLNPNSSLMILSF